MSLQVLADPCQVGPQTVHLVMLVVTVTQDVVQVVVKDVGMEAAELKEVLVFSVGSGHQSGVGVVVHVQTLRLKRQKILV